MRELREFIQWADSITEARGIVSELKGSERDYRDRESQKGDSRLSQARRENPGMSDAEAMLRYTEKQDNEQNKLINALNRENQKLRRTVSDINREVQDLEKSSAETETEVDQIRQSTQRTRETAQQTLATTNDIKKLNSELEQVKADNPKQQQQVDDLRKQLAALSDHNVPSAMLKDLQAQVEKFSKTDRVDSGLVDKIRAEINRIADQTVSKSDLEAATQQIENLKNSRSVSQEQIDKFTASIQELQNKQGMDDKIIKELQTRAEEIQGMNTEQQKQIRDMFDKTKQEFSQYEQNFAAAEKELNQKIDDIDMALRQANKVFFDRNIAQALSDLANIYYKPGSKGKEQFTFNDLVRFMQSTDEFKNRVLDKEAEHDQEIDQQQEINDKQDDDITRIDVSNSYGRAADKKIADDIDVLKANLVGLMNMTGKSREEILRYASGKNIKPEDVYKVAVVKASKELANRWLYKPFNQLYNKTTDIPTASYTPHPNPEDDPGTTPELESLWKNIIKSGQEWRMVSLLQATKWDGGTIYDTKNIDPIVNQVKKLQNIGDRYLSTDKEKEIYMDYVWDLVTFGVASTGGSTGQWLAIKDAYDTKYPENKTVSESKVISDYLGYFSDFCFAITGKYTQ